MSNTSQLDNLHKTPCSLLPLRGPEASIVPFYNWPRSQCYHFLNFVGAVMMQTLSLTTMLQGEPSFTKFNQLPPELRIKIWQFAMPEPRTVVVKAQTRRVPASLDEALPQAFDGEETWRSTTQIPALLHVNAEARHEALKHYTLSLGVGAVKPRVYVDFERDTIFFGAAELEPDCLSLWAKTKDLDKIRRLATVPEGMWRFLVWTNCGLDSLQRLIFVHDTEKIKLGASPQLLEDQPEIDSRVRRMEGNFCEPHSDLDLRMLELQMRFCRLQSLYSELKSPMKQRMQEAREELDTLIRLLPTPWEKEPAISTAVFSESMGDRWVY